VMHEAVQCFLLAARAYEAQQSPLAAVVTEQLATGLEAANRHDAAARYHFKVWEPVAY
jgi:hypothetical protein